MELLDYIRKNYKTPNVAVLRTLGATDELIKYLINTPNNTNMKVVEGLISEGDEDAGNGIRMVSITPAFQMTPAMETVCPIYWNGETQQIAIDAFGMSADTYTVTVTPTADTYAYADVGEEGMTSDAKGAPITFEVQANVIQHQGLPLGVLDDPTDFETFKFVAVLKFTPNE